MAKGGAHPEQTSSLSQAWKTTAHIYGQFRATGEPSFACLRDCGEEAGGEPHRHGGEHAKNLTQQTPPKDQPFVKGATLTAVARRTSALLPNSHVVPVAARWPSANKGATVNLWRERVINLSEGERIKRAHTHGGGSDSSQFMGWSTYSFSHAPAVPPSTVWAATPHGSHREEQHLRVAAPSRPARWWEGTGFVRRRHQR